MIRPGENNNPILIWNRRASRLERERIFSEGVMRFLYETRWGRALADRLLTGPALSRAYGALQDTRWSARKIDAFVREFSIPIQEFETAGGFGSFNEFFARRLKPGARIFCREPEAFPAFAEGRLLAYPRVSGTQALPVKGARFSLAELIGDASASPAFEGGPVWICRLAPIDYHRFHYPDSGRTIRSWSLPGALHSVSPLALRARGDVLTTNERRVTLLEADHFGRLAYIEVGAFCVGRILQTAKGPDFHKGDEKGYFLFGGSTVIIIGTPGAWLPDEDLLRQTEQGHETLVRLGERIGWTQR